MKLNYKKSIKLITLLLASLLIATASATVYTQMFLNTTVGVAGLSLKWEAGTNAGVTCDIDGSTCALDGLDGYPSITAIYNNTVKITNAGTNTVTFNITTTKCDGSTSTLTSIYVKIYNSTGNTLLYTLDVWESNTIGSPLINLQIKAGVTWWLGWEITWAGDAGISDSVDVALRLDVKS
jgi:type 1 fimbria pilin